MDRIRPRVFFGILTVAWLGVAAWGGMYLRRYEGAAGTPAVAPAVWPEGLPIERFSGGATVVLLAHPRCPCSRASVAELRVLMAAAGARARAFVLFYHPAGESPSWARTGTWRAAESVPGAFVLADRDGAAARRLGAATSGQVLVFDRDGLLAFSGGITGARGHAGDNAGLRSALRSVDGGVAARPTAVFGCALTGRKS